MSCVHREIQAETLVKLTMKLRQVEANQAIKFVILLSSPKVNNNPLL